MPRTSFLNLLPYVDAQLAAEAFLRDRLTGALFTSAPDVKRALVDGNGHTSKFTQLAADKFNEDWQVVDQRANTTTGFSGTLLYNTKLQEYVLSIRSTEFIDDAARDNQATNVFEIKETGFAWGQLADLENWYAALSAPGGKLSGGKQFTLTGYSLGGHLATAFNLLHQGVVQKAITFNGAGTGKIIDNSDLRAGLRNALDEFASLRTGGVNAVSATFVDPSLAQLYKAIQPMVASGNIAQARSTLQTYIFQAVVSPLYTCKSTRLRRSVKGT